MGKSSVTFSLLVHSTRFRALTVLALSLLSAIAIGTLYSTGSADLPGQDEQPVAFSHLRHAGELQIACLYCHRAATLSRTAGVPSMQLCVSCHRNLARQNPQTQEVLAYWEQQQPIQWTRLHRLPDFVYFTHQMHLDAGFQCVACHGHVEQMASTPRAASLEMGWCLSCHQAQGASRDCWTCHK
jgi:cytochrome c7-like protein/class III cytochrome C family protein